MRVAVFGAGAVGSLCGMLLQEGGAEVDLIGATAHLAAVAAAGLNVNGRVYPMNVEPAPRGRYDIGLVALGLHHYQTAAPLFAGAAVSTYITLSNGIDAAARLSGLVPRGRAVPGTVVVECYRPAPGAVILCGRPPRLTVGGAALGATLRAAGLSAVGTANPQRAIWRKAAFIVPLTAGAFIARGPVGSVRAEPELWAAVRAAAREICAAGGFAADAPAVEFALERAPRALVPSAARAFLAGTPPAETELCGLVQPITGIGKAPRLASLYQRAIASAPARRGFF